MISLLHFKQNIKKYLVGIGAISLLTFLFLPQVMAATIFSSANPTTARVGDTIIVTVFVDTEGETINTIEGTIGMSAGSDAIAIKDFSLAGSGFSFWPYQPSLSLKDNSISFVGGTPGGVSGSAVSLFKIIAIVKKTGDITFTPQAITAYANNERATTVSVSTKKQTVSVEKQTADKPTDVWQSIIASDATNPYELTAEFGQDASVSDGKKFLVLSVRDNESGFDRFEIQEEGYPIATVTGLTYILQSQTGNNPIVITAYDKAGNHKTITVGSAPSNYLKYGLAVIVLIIILIIVFLFKKKRKAQWRY